MQLLCWKITSLCIHLHHWARWNIVLRIKWCQGPPESKRGSRPLSPRGRPCLERRFCIHIAESCTNAPLCIANKATRLAMVRSLWPSVIICGPETPIGLPSKCRVHSRAVQSRKRLAFACSQGMHSLVPRVASIMGKLRTNTEPLIAACWCVSIDTI